MNAVYNTTLAERKVFSQVDASVDALKKKVASGAWMEFNHAEFERNLKVEGFKLLREFAQSHYSLRCEAKAENPVIGSDGMERTHLREGETRNVTTIFGDVEATRTAYEGRNLGALHPTDANLNLPSGKYSLEVQRQVALGSAQTSFETAIAAVERTTAAHVPKRQAEELVRKASCDFDAFYSETRRDIAHEETSDLLILSFDQKGVVLLAKDLREATRKVAEQHNGTFETKYSKGEPHGRKRLATVAAVYTIAPFVRTTEQIIAGLRHVRDASSPSRPRPENKRVWARLDKDLNDVISDGFAEAFAHDPEKKKRWVVLVDGDPDLKTLVLAEAKQRGVVVTLVLDFIHALEYVWKASVAFFQENDPKRETWVLDRLQMILDGRVSDMVAGMTRSATLRKLNSKQRKPVNKAAKYLLKRTQMMCYDKMLALGGPIATGVIEGACRHLICDRLDITGARWTLNCAEAVLKLRALVSSRDFDAYWTFHEKNDWVRNHASRYASNMPPNLEYPGNHRKLRVVK